MKKLFLLLLVGSLSVSLFACSKTENSANHQLSSQDNAETSLPQPLSSQDDTEDNLSDVSSTQPQPDVADLYEWQNVNGGIEITSYKGNDKTVVVPDIIDNKKVVSISNTFEGNVVIESITIPKYVTKVDLTECDSLKKVIWCTEETVNSKNGPEKVFFPKGLEELVMPNVDYFSFRFIEDSGANLKTLDVSYCNRITCYTGNSLTNATLAKGGAGYAVYNHQGGDIVGLASKEGESPTYIASTDFVWVAITDDNKAEICAEVFGSGCTVTFAEN